MCYRFSILSWASKGREHFEKAVHSKIHFVKRSDTRVFDGTWSSFLMAPCHYTSAMGRTTVGVKKHTSATEGLGAPTEDIAAVERMALLVVAAGSVANEERFSAERCCRSVLLLNRRVKRIRKAAIIAACQLASRLVDAPFVPWDSDCNNAHCRVVRCA